MGDVTTNPDTLFIDRTATGWSLGSITGGVETVHFADVTEMGGVTITADGSALGLWSDMRSSTSPRTLSNLTVPVPEPSTFALLGMGVIGMLLLVRRRTR